MKYLSVVLLLMLLGCKDPNRHTASVYCSEVRIVIAKDRNTNEVKTLNVWCDGNKVIAGKSVEAGPSSVVLTEVEWQD